MVQEQQPFDVAWLRSLLDPANVDRNVLRIITECLKTKGAVTLHDLEVVLIQRRANAQRD